MHKLRSYRSTLDKSIKQMVDLVNKGDFKATVASLGLLDTKGDTSTSDLDTKYARVRQ